PRRHQGHGQGIEGIEGTQELADAEPVGHRGHRRRAEGAEGTHELADAVPHGHQGHGCGGKGPPGSTAWTPDYSLISRLRECRYPLPPTRTWATCERLLGRGSAAREGVTTGSVASVGFAVVLSRGGELLSAPLLLSPVSRM